MCHRLSPEKQTNKHKNKTKQNKKKTRERERIIRDLANLLKISAVYLEGYTTQLEHNLPIHKKLW